MKDKKENGIHLPLHKLHNIIVRFSKMYKYNEKVAKDVEYLLFLIYQDVNEVEETTKRWKNNN